MQFARDNGIRRPNAIIRDVVEALKKFRSVASKNGVRVEWIGRVESTIINHLKSWGQYGDDGETPDFTVDGHIVTGFLLEQQFKGNYLLLTTVDEKDLKYIIRKGTTEHDLLTSTGLANITEDIKKQLFERFLLPKIRQNNHFTR